MPGFEFHPPSAFHCSRDAVSAAVPFTPPFGVRVAASSQEPSIQPEPNASSNTVDPPEVSPCTHVFAGIVTAPAPDGMVVVDEPAAVVDVVAAVVVVDDVGTLVVAVVVAELSLMLSRVRVAVAPVF